MSAFDALLVPAAFRSATDERAWVVAMLEAERALAAASATLGLIPEDHARAVAEACRPERFDAAEILEASRGPGNPVEPLVRRLRSAVGGDAGDAVHRGATSQDVMDTAAMLICREALRLLLVELEVAAGRCADLAERHRSTVMAGRTLFQHAVPITFGLKAAGWLVGLVEARDRVEAARRALPAQLGGAAGTLAAFGDRGLDVLEAFARELGLVAPTVPWHTDRSPVLDVASALARVAAASDKIAFDVLLLSQTDVAEVVEPSAGGSSTMPHKRNPVGSVLTRAGALRARTDAAALLAAPAHELERGAGAWHAEWGLLSDALAHTGGAAWAVRGVLSGLEVDQGRMLVNLAASGGVVMAERAQQLLQEALGRQAALELLEGLLARVEGEGAGLRDLLLKELPAGMDADAVAAAMEPASYLGSVEAFVDRAVARYRGAGARGVSERQRANVASAEPGESP